MLKLNSSFPVPKSVQRRNGFVLINLGGVTLWPKSTPHTVHYNARHFVLWLASCELLSLFLRIRLLTPIQWCMLAFHFRSNNLQLPLGCFILRHLHLVRFPNWKYCTTFPSPRTPIFSWEYGFFIPYCRSTSSYLPHNLHIWRLFG
jgi:hypothetical protein